MSQRSNTADQQMAEARRLTSNGETEAAKHIYHQILAQQPGNKKARKALKALQSQPGGPLTREDFERVTHLMGRGKLEAARAETSQLVRHHPDQPALHNLLGVIHIRMDRPREAVEDYRRALTLQPDFLDAMNNLGAAYHKLGRFEDAVRCYQAMLSQSTKDPDVWYNLGNNLRGMQRFEEAVKSYQASLKLRPLSAQTYNNLGNTYVDLGDAVNAIDAYENALGIRDDLMTAWRSLASTYFSQGRISEAGSCYKRILKDQPDNTFALRGMASVHSSAGRFTAAAENLSRVLALNPDDINARHQLNGLQHRRTDRAPEAYVRSVFDNYAVGFEEHLTGSLSYDGPAQLRKLCDRIDMGAVKGGRGLDLGCGTGLAGVAFRDMAGEFTGVDLSPLMLREAEKKEVYQELIEGDIIKTLPTLSQPADLVIIADTLVYLGRLEPLFRAVAAASAPGARILFTTEHLPEGDFDLLQSARYAHSKDYITHCAGEAGLELLHFELAPLRMERGEWLEGGLYCLAKAA